MEKNRLMLQTLHCHTTNSDGALTHRQVLDVCSQNGIGIVAFTDHDTLPSKSQIKELERLRHPTKYIWGIEITSGYPREIKDKDPNIFHIVGLFVDPCNKKLKQFARVMHQRRLKRLRGRINEFVKLGFEIKIGKVLATVTKNGIPTSLNLVNTLMAHESNHSILERYVQKIKDLSRDNKKVRELYQEMMTDERGDRQKYFNIFLKDESPFKIKLAKQEHLDFDSVVSLIRRAGGLAVLAHWTFERKNLNRKLLEKIVREKRLDGLETVYDLFLLDNLTWKAKIRSDRVFLRRLVKKYGLFASGGVDAHRESDFQLFAAATDYNRETIGLMEAIIKNHRPNLAHSSL